MGHVGADLKRPRFRGVQVHLERRRGAGHHLLEERRFRSLSREGAHLQVPPYHINLEKEEEGVTQLRDKFEEGACGDNNAAS